MKDTTVTKEVLTGLKKSILDHITNTVDGYIESMVNLANREFDCSHYAIFKFRTDSSKRYRELDTDQKIENAIKESPKGFAVVRTKALSFKGRVGTITFYLMNTDSKEGAYA